MIELILLLMVWGNPQTRGYIPPPTPKMNERYVSISGDTSSFLILRDGDSIADIDDFYSAALHNAGEKQFSDFLYDFSSHQRVHMKNRTFILGKWDNRNGFADTVFRGQWDSNFDTLRGTIIIPFDSTRQEIYVKDKDYRDSELLVQDSLLKNFQMALYHGDKEIVASCMEFPLRVWFNHYSKNILLLIKSKRQFLKNYKRIFNGLEVGELLTLSAPFWELNSQWAIGPHAALWDGGAWQETPPRLSIITINDH